jgi:pentatricopeptide repeat domain-containing protein 1
MDLLRLSRLFSGPRPIGLSVLQHLDLVGSTRWTGGREGPARLRAAFCGSSSPLPLGSGNQKEMSSLCSDSSKLSTVAPQEEAEEESFGSLSGKFSSRRIFHKSTAQLYNLQLKEQGGEEEELEPRPWRGRRNTQYWYFFQCKRLIKEGKV